jgi:hypothetical protein
MRIYGAVISLIDAYSDFCLSINCKLRQDKIFGSEADFAELKFLRPK